MGKYKKYKNIVEQFLSGEKGQRFFNFAYSIGAAIVIWGALFKILHLPGGNALLSIGMGTEVLMFILTAFDRPPREYHWEDVFPVFKTKNPEDRPDFKGGGSVVVGGAPVSAGQPVQGEAMGVVGGGVAGAVPSGEVTVQYTDQMVAITAQLVQLRETTEALNKVSNTLLESYRAVTDNSETITQTSAGYVTQMEDLNRNLAGLNTIYEIQLKSISSQLDNIDRVNRGLKEISRMYDRASAESDRYCQETQKMGQYMQQLNSVYEKMLTAMSVNMYRPMAAAPQEPVKPEPQKEEPVAENNTSTEK